MRALIIIMAVALAVQARDYKGLIRILEKDYNKRQQEYNSMTKSKRYKWEFVESWNLPWCHDDLVSVTGGEAAWVPGYGQIVKDCDSGVYIGVMSWIEKKEERSQVTRVYVYQRKAGNWTRTKEIKVVQNWNGNIGWVCRK